MNKGQLIIESIEIYESPIRLKEPFVISLGPLEYADNVVVVIRTAEGINGFGECSPFRMIHGESMETCFLVGQYLARDLKWKNALDIEGCIREMDRTIYGNSSIKSALDIALHDIASQYAGLPLFAFLGGKDNKMLKTDYTISIGPSGKMVADALKIKEAGFTSVKVKLGESKEKDVERIRMIRNAIGPELPMSIDANQGWDLETALATLKALEAYNISHCEEPIPRWQFMQLPYLRKQSPIRIMADESCCDDHDAARLIALSACDYFNVKLGKSGGILKAKKIISLAESAGIKMQVGGFLESRLGFTASAHLALCSNDIIYCDFDTPMMFKEDPVTGGIQYGEKGSVTLPGKPGLGAWIEDDYLSQLKKIVV